MSRSSFIQDNENVDVYDIYELIELGLNKEEIAEEYNVSQSYIDKMVRDFYDDY